MLDLTTTYLGLQLRTPLIASASPLSRNIDMVRRMEAMGASAIVLYSLFEEQILHEQHSRDHYLTRGAYASAGALPHYPPMEAAHTSPSAYLDHLHTIKQAVGIPVIASLNGISPGTWVDYARLIEQAGADALEVTLYYVPTDPWLSSMELEEIYITLVRDIRAQVKLPLAIKLSPFFTALPYMARRCVDAGANALVLFSRFAAPDLDIELLRATPGRTLSTSRDLRLPLRWIALLRERITADLALSGGVHTACDAIKGMMAGANAVMLTSELIEKGPEQLAHILADMRAWMETHNYRSVAEMQGLLSQEATESAAFERASYLRSLNAFDEYRS